MPFAVATFCNTAVVTPEQSAPMIALTPSDVMRRSAVAVAAAASTQVESPRTDEIFDPFRNAPLSLASFIANSAPLAISGVNDSIGPVNPVKYQSLHQLWLSELKMHSIPLLRRFFSCPHPFFKLLNSQSSGFVYERLYDTRQPSRFIINFLTSKDS